jgi:hypothetical protein
MSNSNKINDAGFWWAPYIPQFNTADEPPVIETVWV